MVEWDSHSCWYMSNYIFSCEFFCDIIMNFEHFPLPQASNENEDKKVDNTFEFTSLKTFEEQERRKKCSFF